MCRGRLRRDVLAPVRAGKLVSQNAATQVVEAEALMLIVERREEQVDTMWSRTDAASWSWG
jgi:hypothetical protein